jgi:hypothetical protein
MAETTAWGAFVRIFDPSRFEFVSRFVIPYSNFALNPFDRIRIQIIYWDKSHPNRLFHKNGNSLKIGFRFDLDAKRHAILLKGGCPWLKIGLPMRTKGCPGASSWPE